MMISWQNNYFFSISRIRICLHGILPLINANGWNAAMDLDKL